MWQTIELREIRVFLALAEELHFGRAAERIGLTQSRVSQSLRQLELKLGVKLVDRTSRRVVLTAAGRRFLAEIEPVNRRLAQVLERASGAEGELRGRLRLGLLNAVPRPERVIDIIEVFEQRHPGCGVEVKELALSTRFDPLRRGEVDVIVGPPPSDEPDLTVGPTLSIEPRVLAVAADHPLSARETVSTDDIADYEVVDLAGLVPPDLASALIPERAASGRPLKRRRLEHHDWSELLTTIARGKIVHPAFAEQFAHPSVRCVPIADMPGWESALIWRRDDSGPLLREFVGSAEEALRERP